MLACSETGVRARFLRGRLLRGSAEVGTDSGIFSDILVMVFGGMWSWRSHYGKAEEGFDTGVHRDHYIAKT